jgi:hypothetical protein
VDVAKEYLLIDGLLLLIFNGNFCKRGRRRV